MNFIGATQNASTQGTGDDKSGLLMKFAETVEQLLTGLHTVFPECEKVQKRLRKFRAFVKSPDVIDETTGQIVELGELKPDGAKMLIKDWHSQMSPHYENIAKRNLDAVFSSDLKVLTELDIPIKWQDPDFDQESREYLFQYIDALNQYAQTYCAFPPKMLSRIENVAQTLASQLQNGDLKTSSLDIMSIGQSVIQDCSEEELAEFAGNMGNIQQMMQANLQAMQGQGVEQMAGMPDLSGVMKMMSSFMSMNKDTSNQDMP